MCLFAKGIASMRAVRRIGKVTRLLVSPRGASCEVTRLFALKQLTSEWIRKRSLNIRKAAGKRISEQTKMSSAWKVVKRCSLSATVWNLVKQEVCLSLRECANVIDQIPAICFGKSFAVSRHRLFPGCNLPEKGSVRFIC